MTHPARPQPARTRSPITTATMLRFAGRWILVLGLFVAGLANVYPFFWMMGTSLKSTSESNAARQAPLPEAKLQLADPVAMPEQAARMPLSDVQRALLAELASVDAANRARGGTYIPARITTAQIADKYKLDSPDAAREQVEPLLNAGLLTQTSLQWENYAYVWSDMQFRLHFASSLLVTLAVVLITVLSTAMVGFCLARLSFPGRITLFGLLLVGSVAPREAVIIPIFHLLNAAHLLDGLFGMVLWMSGVGVGNALLMTGYFLSLPKEVEEAAAIDGASTTRAFFDVALPMARPMVITVALLSFLGAWNNFLVPLLCTMTRPELQPLAVAVVRFRAGHAGFWELINASAALMIVPVVVLFIIFQRYIVSSMAAGAVKG